MNIDGVTILKSRNIPTTNETSDTSVFGSISKLQQHRCRHVVSTSSCDCKMMDISLETERDTRRLEDFMVSKMFVGSELCAPKWQLFLSLLKVNPEAVADFGWRRL